MYADTIFYGGDIITMDENNPMAEALAIKDGIITAVGQLDDILSLASDEKTTMIDLHKKTLMPGLIEPHTHPVQMALLRCMFTNIGGYENTSYAEIKLKIQKAITQTKPQAWCLFFGWDPELVRDLPTLSADFLNEEFSSEVPIVITGQSSHIAWANHKALEMAGIEAGIDQNMEDSLGQYFGKGPDGKLTGRIIGYTLIDQVLSFAPTPSYKELCQAIEEQWNEYASFGFTTLSELYYDMTDNCNRALENQARKSDCPIRIALFLNVPNKEDDEVSNHGCVCCNTQGNLVCGNKLLKNNLCDNEKLWVQGYKILADGSPHCGTMAVRDPFLCNQLTETLGFPAIPDSCGHLYYSWDELYQLVKHYHDMGMQVAIHANGDRAIERVISVFEKVLEHDKNNNLRHRMEHVGLITEDQIERGAKVNLTFSFFLAQLYFYGKSFTESIIGSERTNRWSPLSLATKHNVRWTIHQDHGTFPGLPRPFVSIMTAVTRTGREDDDIVYGPEYRVSVHEALKGYTINAAWQINRDKELGSLEVNKKADLLIISDNPYKMAPLKLKDIKVVDTFIDGRSNNISAPKNFPQYDGNNVS